MVVVKEIRSSIDCNQLQADLNKLVLWTRKWQMEFNVDKCKVMHVGNSDNNSSTYYMEGRELAVASYEKDLGVWISEDMKCSKQCLYACNKATKVLGMIKRTIRFKDTRVMLSLYKTLVRPHVEYCVSAWSPHYKKDRELIEKIQRRFTKMINNMDGKSYAERLQCLKLWTLEERRNRQDLIEVFKMCNGISRLKLNEFFTLADNNI